VAYLSPSRPGQRGGHERGTGMRWTPMLRRRTRQRRTAKACGPDVATLASMHLGAFDFPGRNGGKTAVLRGELAISRKATAQGMSDVLRCPVCSCAPFLVQTAHEIAGAARIRHSLRPLDERARKFLAKLGRNASRECGYIFNCRHPRRRVTQYSRDINDRTEKPRRTGSPPARG